MLALARTLEQLPSRRHDDGFWRCLIVPVQTYHGLAEHYLRPASRTESRMRLVPARHYSSRRRPFRI
jgi:hypothetical protein